MATYIPNATQTTEPVESRTVESAALEFRTLKSSINTRIADLANELSDEEAARIAGDAALQVTNNQQDVRIQAIESALLAIGEGGLPGTVYVQRLSGTGVQTAFTLNVEPRAEALIDIFINGLYQQKDSFTVAGSLLTFSEAPPAGTNNIEVVISVTIANVETDASLVSYYPTEATVTPTTVESKLREFVSVKDFGAVGDGVTDDTAAIQAAMNYGLATGKRVFFPAGNYKITDTISLLNSNYVKSFGFFGENGNSTRIYFHNATSLKNMFYVDNDVNYLEVGDLEFLDNTARTSRAFYFFDNTSVSTSPSWKHLFRNVRITQFKEGVRWDGGATPGADTHESEVMFIHSKTRNCETGLIYNNTQAVNHQLIGFDMENDAEGVGDAWTHIKMERGTIINHIGGSVIGKGSYLSYTYSEPGGFQDTSQFASKGVRVEMRGGTVPLINQDTSSTITVANNLRIIIDDMPIVTGGATIFARFGGRSFAKFSNVHANTQLYVEAYMTTNLTGNGLYGGIVMKDCQALTYKRVSTVAAYGSAGVAATNYRAIPAEISYQNEGEQNTIDGSGYIVLSKPLQTVYSGGYQVGQLKTLVYANADNAGFGSGADPTTHQITLPLYGRPCKFRLLRDDVNAGNAFKLDLIAVVSGVDYTVATITPTVNVGGHFEADVQTATGLTYFINDGVNWDGKMKIVKSGTANGFVGLIMVDYM